MSSSAKVSASNVARCGSGSIAVTSSVALSWLIDGADAASRAHGPIRGPELLGHVVGDVAGGGEDGDLVRVAVVARRRPFRVGVGVEDERVASRRKYVCLVDDERSSSVDAAPSAAPATRDSDNEPPVAAEHSEVGEKIHWMAGRRADEGSGSRAGQAAECNRGRRAHAADAAPDGGPGPRRTELRR